MEKKTPVKRGRKPKNAKTNPTSDSKNVVGEAKVLKKRGRKPKGGKIVQNILKPDNSEKKQPNIILHLKCLKLDLDKSKQIHKYQCSDSTPTPLNTSLGYQYVNNALDDKKTKTYDGSFDNNKDATKNIWNKLKELAINMQINNISDKRSDCHWCTYSFDNPPVYIPRNEHNGTYYVYGCFCSPECACAYLQTEGIDSSAKFERLHFLNHLYGKIYDYKKNIKPAPNPYYTLNKYYGTLSIQEYRRLLKSDRVLLVIDRPLSRVLPCLHEDNNHDICTLSNTGGLYNSYSLKKKIVQDKGDILQKNFGTK